MKTIWLVVVAIIAIVVVWLVVASTRNERGDLGSPTPTIEDTTTASRVEMQNSTFSPSTLTVKVGDTISFVNNDNTQHTVTSNSFNSGVLNPGTVFNYTFSEAGTFDFRCTIHPEMTCSIRVQ